MFSKGSLGTRLLTLFSFPDSFVRKAGDEVSIPEIVSRAYVTKIQEIISSCSAEV